MSRTVRSWPHWVHRWAKDYGHQGDVPHDEKYEKFIREQSTDKCIGNAVGAISKVVEKPDFLEDEYDGPRTHKWKKDYARYWRHRHKNELKIYVKKDLEDDIEKEE